MCCGGGRVFSVFIRLFQIFNSSAGKKNARKCGVKSFKTRGRIHPVASKQSRIYVLVFLCALRMMAWLMFLAQDLYGTPGCLWSFSGS